MLRASLAAGPVRHGGPQVDLPAFPSLDRSVLVCTSNTWRLRRRDGAVTARYSRRADYHPSSSTAIVRDAITPDRTG